jgi:predicted ATPase
LRGAVTAETIAPILAETLGLPPADDGAARLKAYLGDKKLLLLLDNASPGDGAPGDAPGGATAFLAELLTAAPGLRLLATAVEPLGIGGERPLSIAGLADAGGLDSPAAQLFIQTARRVRHDFAPDTADEAAIMRICQLTAGSPLALETAAAWARLLTCAQIADHLEQGGDLGLEH